MAGSRSAAIAAPARCRTRLDTIGACKTELGKVYRLTRSGKIAPDTAGRLCSLLVALARLIEGGEIENRLAVLEGQEKRRKEIQP